MYCCCLSVMWFPSGSCWPHPLGNLVTDTVLSFWPQRAKGRGARGWYTLKEQLARSNCLSLLSSYSHTPSETNGICGKSVSLVNMTRPYVDPSGIRYRCTSKNLIKQVLCTPRCVNNKKRCNCKPQDVPPKRRKFICVACSENAEPQSIEVSLEVNITSRCVCFECCQNTNTVWSCAIYRHTQCYL